MNQVEGYRTASPQNFSLMRVFQSFEGLQHHEEGVGERQSDAFGSAALEYCTQVLAVHVLHRDVVGLVDLAEVENLNNVGVGEQTREFGLLDESVYVAGVCRETRRQSSDREESMESSDAIQARLVDG